MHIRCSVALPNPDRMVRCGSGNDGPRLSGTSAVPALSQPSYFREVPGGDLGTRCAQGRDYLRPLCKQVSLVFNLNCTTHQPARFSKACSIITAPGDLASGENGIELFSMTNIQLPDVSVTMALVANLQASLPDFGR